MAKPHSIRVGADIGGTFTDVVLETATQQVSAKVLTTYAAPENGIVDGIQQACAKAGVQPSQINQIIHGTTLATNALIERNGAKTALITTEGFRDVIEMRTESRFAQYDLNLVLPEPLLPRQQRYTIAERIDAQGKVLLAADREQIKQLALHIKAAGYQSVAVGLLHSYLNNQHEVMVREVLNEIVPAVMVSISSEVSPQMREYERFNTVVANAYIKPLMHSYLSRLKSVLSAQQINCEVLLMHSGGGIISLASAAEFPVRLVESGPAGGAVFAATIAEQYELDKVISFDMGGTTAKICLINNYRPKTSRVFEVARSYRFKKGSGMPISIPVIDMVEIGAGGGSLARVDAMQQIRVGPESASSEPGPACYQRGGTQPAVTDADLILGKLDADNFAGGRLPLSAHSAATALVEQVGEPLQMDALTSAFGVAEVVDENMANAARVHAVENGQDLSHYTMIAFGGAAPLHAGRLCEKLGIERCLIPTGAGVGSAIGFLRAPYSFVANRSVYMRLSQFLPDTVSQLFAQLQAEAKSFVRRCEPTADIEYQFKVYMRYSGQGWEIPVVLSSAQATDPQATVFQQAFEHDYQTVFDRIVDGADIEITVWSVTASTAPVSSPPTSKPIEPTAQSSSPDSSLQYSRSVFDAALGTMTQASVVARQDLNTGQNLAGPAVISEDETTIIVPSSCDASKYPDGCINIQTKQVAK